MDAVKQYFHRGDLVEVDYGYGGKSVGIFMRYYGPHNGHWASRAWVFVDGDDLPIPTTQITLVRAADLTFTLQGNS